MYYLSSTKIQDNLINLYDREQHQGLLERYMSNYRKLVSEAIYYAIPTMFKVKALKVPYGICPPKKMAISFHAYMRRGPATKQSNNCSLVKLKGKENWNKNSLSVFIYKFQAYNKLSAAGTVYSLALTLGGA